MNRKLSLILSTCALAPAALVAGCGGVPGNSVAEVDGTTIEKSTFDHWMRVAAKSSGQPGATVPVPPDFTECIAKLKKAQAEQPAEGQPKQTDAQLKEQCRTQYETLRDQVMRLLIQFEWIEGEAAAQGIEVTDAEVRKSFEEQKKQSFPKEADYRKFLEDTGQTEEDILRRVRLDLLATKLQEKIVEGKDKVTDAQIAEYYEKNKARFAQPERRDLRIVRTEKRADAIAAKKALEAGEPWKSVVKRYSVDEATKSAGGKLPGVAEGQQEQALDEAVFKAEPGLVEGPVETQFGYYVFTVEKVTPADQQTLEEAKATIEQLLAAQNQQKAVESFSKSFEERWKEKTECAEDFEAPECANGPDPSPTPTGDAGGQGGSTPPPPPAE